MNERKVCQEFDLDRIWHDEITRQWCATRDGVTAAVGDRIGLYDAAEELSEALAEAGASKVLGRVRDWETGRVINCGS